MSGLAANVAGLVLGRTGFAIRELVTRTVWATRLLLGSVLRLLVQRRAHVIGRQGPAHTLPRGGLLGDVAERGVGEAEKLLAEQVIGTSPNDAEDKKVFSGEGVQVGLIS